MPENLTRGYYEGLTGHLQEMRRLQHDMQHHFRVIDAYAQQGRFTELRNYLREVTDSITDQANALYCANDTANILLGHYAEKTRETGVRFHCDAQIPAALAVKSTHLCVLLGNALQNALDGCGMQAPGEDRFINLLVRINENHLVLKLKNSFDGGVRQNLQTRKEAKKGHGLGLESIRSIAKRYHGYCSAVPEGKEFILQVVLNLEAPED